jgi:hypothetical protein
LSRKRLWSNPAFGGALEAKCQGASGVSDDAFDARITEYETLSGRQLEPQITIAPGQDLLVMVNNQCPNFLAHRRFVIKIVVVLRR